MLYNMMQTPFYDQHVSSGAKILDFHGWDQMLDCLMFRTWADSKLLALVLKTVYKTC